MTAVFAALALVSGVIGAGFASGREILCFFAAHGAMAYAGAALAVLSLCALFLRLPSQMARYDARTLPALCRARLGARFGALCAALFFLLAAITGGAMLAACAELGALMLPIRRAYGLTMILTLALAAVLARLGLHGLAAPGAALALMLPALLFSLARLPRGEACFLPAMAPDLPVRAAVDGVSYAALNCAMLAGMLPLLSRLDGKTRRRAALGFALVFGLILSLGVAACLRHLPAILHQPLPFVFLSRRLGAPGYVLVGVCMHTAALSTLCAMLAAMTDALARRGGLLLAAALCLAFARVGFGAIVSRLYPVLGALCAGLLLVLCMGVCPRMEKPL